MRSLKLEMEKRNSYPIFNFMWVVLLLLSLLACQRKANTDQNIVHVFAAASLKEALEEIGTGFTSETGLEVSFNFAGSNVLARQIVASSQSDLFISADAEWMNYVEGKGRMGENTRIDLLENELVAVCPLDAVWTASEPASLCELDFEFLCIGDPEAVPAGRYARAFLERVRCGGSTVWEVVQAKVSPSPDVRAALAQVLSRRDAIAMVYRTDYLLFKDRLRLLFEATGVGIRYPAAMTSNGMEKQAAGRFFLFLQSDDARLVFTKYGFVAPELAGE